MSQAEYDTLEADILTRLREIKERQQGPAAFSPPSTRSRASMPHSKATSTSDLRRSAAPTFRFVGGKGGVGKTTCAAALGVLAARAGQRTLIVSTDPAPSLGDALRQPLGRLPARSGASPVWKPWKSTRPPHSPRGSRIGAGCSKRSRCAAPGWMATMSPGCCGCHCRASTRSQGCCSSRTSPPAADTSTSWSTPRRPDTSCACWHARGPRGSGGGVRSDAGQAPDHGRRAARRLDPGCRRRTHPGHRRAGGGIDALLRDASGVQLSWVTLPEPWRSGRRTMR